MLVVSGGVASGRGGGGYVCVCVSEAGLFRVSPLPLAARSAKMAFYFLSMLLLPLKSYFC